MQIDLNLQKTELYRMFDSQLPQVDKICVAVSGGVDSMALVHCAALWAHLNQAQCYAVTVDHHLRPNSTEEAKQVSIYLNSKNIRHEILDWKHQGIIHAIQAKARKARYQLLEAYCVSKQIPVLLVAHHLLDQVETYYLRKEKGSGPLGLSGMQTQSYLNELILLRPFLKCDKSQLIEFCEASKIIWFEDPSNENVTYRRNLIRKSLTPGAIEQAKIELFEANKKRRQILELLKKWCGNALSLGTYGEVRIRIFPELLEDSIEALSFWGMVLRIFSGKDYAPKFEKRRNLIQQLAAQTHLVKTLWGVRLERRGDQIHLSRERRAIQDERLRMKNGERLIWDHRFEIELNLTQPEFKHSIWEVEILDEFHQLFSSIPFINRKTLPILRNTDIRDCILFPFEGKLRNQDQWTDLGEACKFQSIFAQCLSREFSECE